MRWTASSPRWRNVTRATLTAAAILPVACGNVRSSKPLVPPAAQAAALPRAPPKSDADATPTWPKALAAALAGRGEPHAQPLMLSQDGQGRSHWLAFVGTVEAAWGAWRVALGSDGGTEIEPVEHWPAGVHVLGGVVERGVAYVLLESVEVLDQPAGLRGTWIDAAGLPSPFDASPLSLADARDATELAARVKLPPSADRDPSALLAVLKTASTSTATLASALGASGADVRIAWQSLFTQRVGHLGAEPDASSALASAMLSVVREALATRACGAEACEAWTDVGRAVVRFAREGERWTIREIIEDAPAAREAAGTSPLRSVSASVQSSETEAMLRARAREVRQVLGQAPLTAGGGTIGVGLTDLAPETPVVAVREGAAVRVFAVGAGVARAEAGDGRWEAAFADVDGDGRTDVVLRFSGTGPGGLPLAWAEAFLAPAPSVQASSLEADLASALALMDAPDASSAASAATRIPLRGVLRDDACRLLSSTTTPAGFRRHASGDARLFHFDEPGMPTWRAKIVPLAKLALDDVRAIAAHCAELVCSPTRPYCAWVGGADSEHFWFDWRDDRLEILGAADYDGE